jgi:hypothetical protein
MNHELMVTGYDTGSGQDLNRLRAHLERLEDLARYASPIDLFRLKHSIQLVTVAMASSSCWAGAESWASLTAAGQVWTMRLA